MSSQSAAKKDDVGKPAIVTATKDLYEIGEIPPLGHVPKNMYAWAIRASARASPIRPCRSKSFRPGNSTATTCSSS